MKKKDQESLRKIVIIGLVLVVGYLGYQSMTSGSSPFSKASEPGIVGPVSEPGSVIGEGDYVDPFKKKLYECKVVCNCFRELPKPVKVDVPITVEICKPPILLLSKNRPEFSSACISKCNGLGYEGLVDRFKSCKVIADSC